MHLCRNEVEGGRVDQRRETDVLPGGPAGFYRPLYVNGGEGVVVVVVVNLSQVGFGRDGEIEEGKEV